MSLLATISFAHSSSQNHRMKVLVAGTVNFDSKFHIDKVLAYNAEVMLPIKYIEILTLSFRIPL